MLLIKKGSMNRRENFNRDLKIFDLQLGELLENTHAPLKLKKNVRS